MGVVLAFGKCCEPIARMSLPGTPAKANSVEISASLAFRWRRFWRAIFFHDEGTFPSEQELK